jgi:acyl carrier protein
VSEQDKQHEKLKRIAAIVKRDLMLPPGMHLLPETPLFGGELDLDSLDALLLMQSLEAEFRFKMPTEAFGPEVFKNLTTLARFVDEQCAAAPASGQP